MGSSSGQIRNGQLEATSGRAETEHDARPRPGLGLVRPEPGRLGLRLDQPETRAHRPGRGLRRGSPVVQRSRELRGLGLVVGAVAKLIMPGKGPGGWIITILLGLAGSLVASYLGRLVGWYKEGQSAGFIMSVLGATLVLFVYRLIIGQKTA